MPHEKGAYLGGIRTIAHLRERCVIRPGDSCWHLRTARGRQPTPGCTSRVWLAGHGAVSATRAAWSLRHGDMPPPGLVVYRACQSGDCVRPTHLRLGTRLEAARASCERGAFDTLKRKTSTLRMVDARRAAARLQAPQILQIVSSPEPARIVAAQLGVSPSWVSTIRRRHANASGSTVALAWAPLKEAA